MKSTLLVSLASMLLLSVFGWLRHESQRPAAAHGAEDEVTLFVG